MKKINCFMAMSLIMSLLLNPISYKIYAQDASLREETLIDPALDSNIYGTGDTVYNKLLDKNWTLSANGTLTSNDGRVKFRNLGGVNGKDAVFTLRASDEANDLLALEALGLMRGTGSQLSTLEIGKFIANGTNTFNDGTRYIDVHYDGQIDYTITVTYYSYDYTPKYFLPSWDNPEMVTAIENTLNTNSLAIESIGLASSDSPLKLKFTENSGTDASNLFNQFERISDTILAAEKVQNENETVINLSFKKTTGLLNNIQESHLGVAIKVDNTYDSVLLAATSFMETINSDTDTPVIPDLPEIDTPVIPDVPDNDQPVIPDMPDNDQPETDQPVTPDVPDNDQPETDTPVTPDVPDNDQPETDQPVIPDVPDNDQPETDQPVIPDVPDNDHSDSSDNANLNISNNEVLNHAIASGIIRVDATMGSVANNSALYLEIANVDIQKIVSLFSELETLVSNVEKFETAEYTFISFKIKNNLRSIDLAASSNADYNYYVIKIDNQYSQIVEVASNFVTKLTPSNETIPPVSEDNSQSNNVNTSGNNTVQQDDTSATDSNKNYPQTGLTASGTMSLIGAVTTVMGLFTYRQKKK